MHARCKFPWRRATGTAPGHSVPGVTAALLLLAAAGAATAQMPHVAVTAIVEQSALDAVREGLREGLAAAGYVAGRGLRYDFVSARADPQAAAAIVRRFAGERPTVIVAISTPSAQAAVAAAPQTPIVFVGVEAPAADGGALPPNMTGLTQPPPGADMLRLMREFMPGLRRVALLRGTASARAEAAETGLREAAAGLGLQFESRTVATPEEARAAAEALAAGADAFVLVNDPAVARAMPALVAVAEAKLRPLFALDSELVPRGAVAALEYDNYRVGKQLAGVVLRLLGGEPVSAIPVAPALADRTTVNIDAAERTGTRVPPAVLARAAVIVD